MNVFCILLQHLMISAALDNKLIGFIHFSPWIFASVNDTCTGLMIWTTDLATDFLLNWDIWKQKISKRTLFNIHTTSNTSFAKHFSSPFLIEPCQKKRGTPNSTFCWATFPSPQNGACCPAKTVSKGSYGKPRAFTSSQADEDEFRGPAMNFGKRNGWPGNGRKSGFDWGQIIPLVEL